MHIKQPQLKYTRSHVPPVELGGTIAPMVHRIYMPEHFLKILDECSSIITPIAGSRFSFYHSLLYTLFPPYRGASWTEKETLVSDFRKEIGAPLTDVPHLDAAFMTALANLFNINIILVDNLKITKYICVFDTLSVFFYLNDLAVYQPVLINGSYYVFNYI